LKMTVLPNHIMLRLREPLYLNVANRNL